MRRDLDRLRDVVHGWDAVWAVVEKDLGPLRAAVETILEAEME